MSGSLLDANQAIKDAFVETKNAFQMIPVSNLINGAWDYMSLTQASTTDTYLFKSGGSGGSTTCTVTVTFTDSTKATISTVART